MSRGEQPWFASAGHVGIAQSAAADEHEHPIVLVVDDDVAVRRALIELMESVGLEAAGFASARELMEVNLPDRPGCLVLDVRMPGGSGLDLQQQLALQGFAKPVVFLTGHGDIPMSVQAMKGGAIDFLTKPVRDQTLLDAVMMGIERDTAQRRESRVIHRLIEDHSTLTSRERQVMRSVALGRLNKQIAYDLGISVVTVKLHRSSVMRKMRAKTIGDLIRAWELLPPQIRESGAT
ncbi:response regulator transcription factor [Sphingosinicella sp. CPCC 101087]|uniref:response regulator transcription factor n=1 Tax=Sphingosinicella sp. CPCC 101087 TaxID=2497754 RepID=UPI00101CC124|nr:response regulator [Sphingosinicella sp. CPCC 101087]